MTKPGWQNAVTDTSIVYLTPGAQAYVEAWLVQVSTDPKMRGHVGTLSYVICRTDYDAAGQLQGSTGPHLSLGAQSRTDIPPEQVVRFLGHDMFLRLNPFTGDEVLRRVDVRLEGGVLLPTFDPPAPEVPAHPFPSIAEWMDNTDLDEKDKP